MRLTQVYVAAVIALNGRHGTSVRPACTILSHGRW